MRLLVAALLLSATASAEPRLLALSKGDHTLAIVDPKALKVVGKVAVGPDPHEVASDGKRAYVSNTGSGKFHEIDVIDLQARKALPMIDTGALIGPHGLSLVNGKLWFTAEGAKAIARLDLATSKVDLILGTGQDRTHMLHATHDEKRVFATNVDSGSISIFEGGEAWTQTVVPGDKGNEGFDVSPDGKQLWTAAASDGKILIVDLGTKKLLATIDANVVGANRLAFTPDGKRVLVTTLKSGDVSVYATDTRKLVKKINVGHGAAGLVVETDHRAFAACTPDDYIAVIDLDKLEVTSHLDVGAHPDGLAWIP